MSLKIKNKTKKIYDGHWHSSPSFAYRLSSSSGITPLQSSKVFNGRVVVGREALLIRLEVNMVYAYSSGKIRSKSEAGLLLKSSRDT